MPYYIKCVFLNRIKLIMERFLYYAEKTTFIHLHNWFDTIINPKQTRARNLQKYRIPNFIMYFKTYFPSDTIIIIINSESTIELIYNRK